MLQQLQAISDKVNNVIASLKQDYHKYAAVLLAGLLALVLVYKNFSAKVRTQELVSESVLHLAAGNVHITPGANGEDKTLGRLGDKDKDSVPERAPYIPPEATVIITPKDKTQKLTDIVNISIQDKFGFSLEPGLDVALAPAGIGLDFKLLYAWKFGAEVGFDEYVYPVDAFSPTLGLSYRLDRYSMLKNTELKLSYAPLLRIPLSFGIRVNF